MRHTVGPDGRVQAAGGFDGVTRSTYARPGEIENPNGQAGGGYWRRRIVDRVGERGNQAKVGDGVARSEFDDHSFFLGNAVVDDGERNIERRRH